jgi:hypothetical protein
MSAELDADSILLLRPGFLWEVIEDGCLLFEEASGRMLTLSRLAELVLVHSTGEFTAREICGELARLFEVKRDEAMAACRNLLAEGVIELRR